MRGPVFACLLGILPFCGGCLLTRQIAHDSKYEVELFDSVEKRRHHIHHEARDVLKEVCNRHPHKVFSHDYRHGFVDGYFDFMEYGGPVRPPAMPPAKYRTAKYLSPEGQCQIREYNLGFLYGAQCADSTGRRQYFTVPVLVTPTTAPPVLNITMLPPLPEDADATKPNTPMVPEVAPVPKTVTPAPMTPTPMPMAPQTKAEPPKTMTPMTPKVDPPKTTPVPVPMPMTPATPVPMTTPLPTPRPAPVPELPPAETPKVDPKIDPMALPPKVDPKVDPKPPVNTSIPVPLPTLPVPIPVAPSGPPPIPLIPTLPTVSLGLPPASSQAIVPVSGTVPAP